MFMHELVSENNDKFFLNNVWYVLDGDLGKALWQKEGDQVISNLFTINY